MHCLELGDYVGVESCFDSIGADLESGMSNPVGRSDGGGGKREKGIMKPKEYPPPIPWLAWTANSPSSRMPWVLKRYHTEDGRLIITGVKAERHEYFEAHRSGGRLRLHLVPLNVLVGQDPFVKEPDEGVEEKEEGHGGDHHSEGGGTVGDGCDAGGGGDRTATALEDRSAMTNGGSLITDSCGGGGGNKYSNSFIFGVAVTAIPPVHT